MDEKPAIYDTNEINIKKRRNNNLLAKMHIKLKVNEKVYEMPSEYEQHFVFASLTVESCAYFYNGYIYIYM